MQLSSGVTTAYTLDPSTGSGQATYTWDNNGNLLNDGMWAYTYDAANRLTRSRAITGNPQPEYSFVYNGLGDRLQQSVVEYRDCFPNVCDPLPPMTTTYTLDLNAGLTQVLADGTNTYLYGNGRIAQNSTANGKQYFLGDALGSVRQLVSASGAITLTQSYEPYGSVLMSAANAGISTAFGFTGEATDGYLRARYYSFGVGRFITKDPSRTEANLYLYALANPINWTDPSGLNPNCQPEIATAGGAGAVSYVECARDRFFEITTKDDITAGKNALTLVALFEDAELHNLWGDAAGRTAAKRLDWVLSMTRGSTEDGLFDTAIRLSGCFPNQFGNNDVWGNKDTYFKAELRDNQFYQIEWNRRGANSSQVGHFLTAVALSFYGASGVNLIIAHEKMTDNTYDPISSARSSNIPSQVLYQTLPIDYRRWNEAVTADETGSSFQRDQKLWAILGLPPGIGFGEVAPSREGNSLQDLRLSVKGYRFGKWVQHNGSLPPGEAARWLRRNILRGISKNIE